MRAPKSTNRAGRSLSRRERAVETQYQTVRTMAPGRRGGGFAALARTFLLLLIAGGVQRVLGEIGSNVITRVVGGLVA